MYFPERKTGAATACPTKHAGKFVVSWMLANLTQLGFKDIRLRVDPDVTTKAIAQRVQEGRTRYQTIVEHTPVRSNQSLGGAERFHCTVQDEMRVLKTTLEENLGTILLPEIPLGSCLVSHVSWILRTSFPHTSRS